MQFHFYLLIVNSGSNKFRILFLVVTMQFQASHEASLSVIKKKLTETHTQLPLEKPRARYCTFCGNVSH